MPRKKKKVNKSEINIAALMTKGLVDLIVGVLTALIIKCLT